VDPRRDEPEVLALHACCGPCLIEPYDDLAGDFEVVVVYANPNIHPLAEYERRRDVAAAYAEQAGARFIELPYEPSEWLARAGAVSASPAQRCRECYRLRLEKVAKWAAANGVDAVTTTLTVSPYQDPDAITAAGESVAGDVGVRYVARDYRERYPQATRRSRELGMYRQNYCGCVMSELEAAERRRQHKAARRRG